MTKKGHQIFGQEESAPPEKILTTPKTVNSSHGKLFSLVSSLSTVDYTSELVKRHKVI